MSDDAPKNSLPDWSECCLRVENSNFIDKRIAEGGFGYEEPGYYANELHRFIYEYDDADPYKSAWFLHRLEKLIEFVRSDSAHDAERTAILEAELADRRRELEAVKKERDDLAMELEDAKANLAAAWDSR